MTDLSPAAHTITPPPELVQQWTQEWLDSNWIGKDTYIATQAARWGADQELEACCEWLDGGFGDVGNFPATLRANRRPKPPSLKEQALKALDDISIASFEQDAANTIREALEQLDD